MTKSRGIQPTRKRWTEAEIEFLARLYPDLPTVEIAAQLGVSIGRVYAKAALLGIKKSDAYLASPEACRLRRGDDVGAPYRFKPGHPSWNTGVSYQPGGRSAETRFKAGQKPHTWRPIGSERTSKEGYLQVKLTDTGCTRRDYVPMHHLVWELHRGPIPDGYRVAFKDGNKTHIAIENLELVSIGDMMRRNTVHNLPKEIVEVVQLRGALVRKINNRMKKETNEQRNDR